MYESNIIWLLKQLNISLDQYGREEMKSEDITPSQGWVLNYLFSCGEQATYATDIHAECGISMAAISSTVASSLSIVSAGLPGTQRIRKNTITATMIRVGIADNSRRIV